MSASFQNQIPSSTIKYTQLSSATETKTSCLQYLTLTITRQKIVGLVIMLALAGMIVIYSCVSCDVNCSSYCWFLERPGNLLSNAAYDRNTSYATLQGTQAKPLQRRLPQCIIIGARKAGTRALLSYLNLHPDVVQSPREQHFFDVDDNYAKGLEYYRTSMPFSAEGQLTIEKSPSYFIEPDVPERVYRMNNSIKLLLIVRDPVIRAISDYEQLILKASQDKWAPFEHFVVDHRGRVKEDYKPIQISIYHQHLALWLNYFSPSQILIIDGDQYSANPYPELHKIESFLGLEHKISEDLFYYNATKGFFCVANQESPCLGPTKGREHSFVKLNIIKKLRAFFKPHNEKFFNMINQTFNWDK